jgi:phosphinothricin acetyltransferase
MAIREATMADLPAMAQIYNEQVRTSVATFDMEERGTAYLGSKLGSHAPGDLVIVASSGEEVVGYALSGPFRPRPAYAGTKETSVYVAEGARGLGLGRRLYAALLGRLDELAEVHTQVAVIALPNPASEALHRSFGFDHVGTLREVGQKFGRFVDTAWYQRLSRTD